MLVFLSFSFSSVLLVGFIYNEKSDNLAVVPNIFGDLNGVETLTILSFRSFFLCVILVG